MKSVMMLIMAMIMTTVMLYGEAMGQPPPMPAEEQPQVLTRGPVNEAFVHRQRGRPAMSLPGCRATGPGIRTGTGISG
jgi:hypothetical protein